MSDTGQVETATIQSEAIRLPRPGVDPAPSPMRGSFDRWFLWATAPFVAVGHTHRGRFLAKVAHIANTHEEAVVALSDGGLRDRARIAAAELRRRRRSLRAFAHVAALVREAVCRGTGLRLNDRQIQGAAAMWRGMIAEMETGEGKTLTAVVPAAAAALTGRRVHVITVTDYLAARDHELTREIYKRLGLEISLITKQMPPIERFAAYQAPIVYASNKEIAFDHLRDRTERRTVRARVAALTMSSADGADGTPRRLPELDFSIIDEADSVLVDEARTPLVLSGEASGIYDHDTCRRALALAASLEPRRDFKVDDAQRRVDLTVRGRSVAGASFRNASDRWASPIYREELVRQALSALHLFKRDRDYLVCGDAVQIVDEYTGRVFADRSWSMGLHQLIEVKEGLEPSPENVPIGRMTYQSLFGRYRTLCGMTGTIAEAAPEVWQVYRLRTARIPTARPSRRKHRPDRIFRSETAKQDALVERVRELQEQGAPVLIGTRTVAASVELSERFHALGIPHALLNAVEEAEEASIIAEAGCSGRVTIATNMAGRGTDIRPDAAALSQGGLHVILTERHDAGRIDRQLQGRCARQGEPGTSEAFLSLEDRILARNRLGPLMRVFFSLSGRFPFLGRFTLRSAQKKLERTHAYARRQLLLSEHNLDRVLAFSGERE